MRVKEGHRGEEELQEGCVSFRASEGRGKGATHVSCIRGEQAVVRGQTGTWPRPENEKGELQEVSWKDKAGSGRDQKCLILHPRSAARGEPCSTGADVGRGSLPQPGAKCWATRGEQALGPKAF